MTVEQGSAQRGAGTRLRDATGMPSCRRRVTGMILEICEEAAGMSAHIVAEIVAEVAG